MHTAHTENTTLAQQHGRAVALLLDYDKRAQIAAQGQQRDDMQSTWFGLHVHVGQVPLLLPQQQLAEVLPPPALTPIPGTPPWLLGLANHYGQLLPVADLYAFMHGKSWPNNSRSRVIVTDTEPSIGLMVTALGSSVRTAPPQALTPQLTLPDELRRWVSGQVQKPNENIAVLEVAPLLDAIIHWKRH